jgi:putative inorganic carbon (hco3(-)) transporter
MIKNNFNNEKSLMGQEVRPTFTFYIFILWMFVLMARPQDIITFLVPLRPALSIGVITIFLILIRRPKNVNRDIFKSNQSKLFLGLVAIMVISIPFAIYRKAAFVFLFQLYISGVIFYILFYKFIDSIKKIESSLFLACMATGVYGLFAIIKGISIGDNRLAFGTMFDPNDLAYFVVSFLPVNFLFISKDYPTWKRIVCLGNIFLGILLILMTQSRGGLVALVAIFFMILFSRARIFKTSQKILFVLIGVIGILLLSNKLDLSRFKTITNLSSDYNTFDETGRFAVWKKGFTIMLHHPLTGVGVSCFEQAIGQLRLKEGLQERWQAPHNSLVQIGTETGIVGLILFLLLSYRAFKIFNFAKRKENYERISKIGELLNYSFLGNFVASMFLSQAYSIYWIFFIATSASIQTFLKDESIAK